jgi:hypothetical protein
MTTRLLSVFVVGAAILTVPAYPQSTGETARARYTLTIRGKQNSFKVGDEIRVAVTWKNTSGQPVLNAPEIPTAETKYRVYVQDEKGVLATETKMGRRIRTRKGEQGQDTVTVTQTGPFKYFQPGETMTEEIVLNKVYDLSKPGTYFVRVQPQGDSDASAQSNTVMITLTENVSDRTR